MSSIQIKHVPEDMHEAARRRAASQGKTLTDYALGLLREDLELPTVEEWIERVKSRKPIRGIDAVASIHEAREEREEELTQNWQPRGF